jgi:hypothetical protein
MNECPTCHRPFGATKRICFSCRRPIARNDKWHIEGCYILHDDCQNPTIRVLVKAPQPSQPMLDGTAGQETPGETEENRSTD